MSSNGIAERGLKRSHTDDNDAILRKSLKLEPDEESTLWKTLKHNGVYFRDLQYTALPESVKFYYDGKVVKLEEPAEEVAGFYAKILNHDDVNNDQFKSNFFSDWRTSMSVKEKKVITDLSKCNFSEIHAHFIQQLEARRNQSKEEKNKWRETSQEIAHEYGVALIDGEEVKLNNYKIEPPGLFKGRGDHPKMGCVKSRILPEHVTINCSRGKEPSPPDGHKWKEIRHDNTVPWLASWTIDVNGITKYLNINVGKLKRSDNVVKKPATPFTVFCQDNKESYLLKFPEIGASDVYSKLADVWNSMDTEEKTCYVKKAEKLGAEFTVVMNVGGWVCPKTDCWTPNYNSRATCRKCRTNKDDEAYSHNKAYLESEVGELRLRCRCCGKCVKSEQAIISHYQDKHLSILPSDAVASECFTEGGKSAGGKCKFCSHDVFKSNALVNQRFHLYNKHKMEVERGITDGSNDIKMEEC